MSRQMNVQNGNTNWTTNSDNKIKLDSCRTTSIHILRHRHTYSDRRRHQFHRTRTPTIYALPKHTAYIHTLSGPSERNAGTQQTTINTSVWRCGSRLVHSHIERVCFSSWLAACLSVGRLVYWSVAQIAWWCHRTISMTRFRGPYGHTLI